MRNGRNAPGIVNLSVRNFVTHSGILHLKNLGHRLKQWLRLKC